MATPLSYAEVDAQGRLVLPPEVAAGFGLTPGTRVQLEDGPAGLRMRRPVTHLTKLYIEPTNCCNLACRTCVRNVWDEPLGYMTPAVFQRVLDGVKSGVTGGGTPPFPRPQPPKLFFGGFGEPLAHPGIVQMVAAAKALGAPVELITNGVLLTEATARGLIAAGLDRLWVSLDGARPESYADVRLGAALPEVLANLARFRDLRPAGHRPSPEIGIAFVAMQRNIADLPALLNLGDRLGAARFMVTNLLPHTAEMRRETLYDRVLTHISYLPSRWVSHVSLPKMDVDPITGPVLYEVLRGDRNVSFAGGNLGATNDRCPFIEEGAAAVGWDGRFSPCLTLLHSHTSFLDERERHVRCFVVGNVGERDLGDLWHAPEHRAFRERVQGFQFSPCSVCGGCELSLANEADCFGNNFPTCGGCLWAQGVIQCP